MLSISRSNVLRVSVLLLTSVASLPVSQAVHNSGAFELDGNAMAGATPGDDWSTLFPVNNSTTVFNASFVHEPSSTDTTFFTIGSKDIDDVSQWYYTGNSAPDKDQILDAFAATYNSTSTGQQIFFGADRFANNGDSAVGFWFLQGNVGLGPNGNFTGHHVLNDTFVVSHFTNGGGDASIYVYKWTPGAPNNLVLLATGGDCASAPLGDTACASVNSGNATSPWPFVSKGNKPPVDTFLANEFFEGGVDLGALYGGNVPCFSSFLVETRSSQSITATLKDLVFGQFNNCPIVPPQATIAVDKFPLAPVVDLGQPIGYGLVVTNSGPDPAADLMLWDDMPAVSGTWSADNPACTVTGTNLTCAFGTVGVFQQRFVNITAGTAVVADCGPWPNFARITANGGLSNDQSSPVQVYVTCADVGVVKTAAAAAIDLGANLTFDLTITSYGPDPAVNATLSDTLPSVSGAWDLRGANATDCSITGLALACAWATIPVNDTRSITVTALTAGAGDCGQQDNTATVRARVDTNASNNASSASTYVRCSDVSLDKAAVDGDIYIGINATYTLTVTSNGPDTATNVTLTDNLPDPPGGWAILDASGGSTCAITAGVLGCDFGNVPNGESRFVTVTAATGDAQTDCGLVSNSATVGADVDLDAANNTDSANIIVRCSDVSISKTAASESVNVGGDVSFTLTVSSAGPDDAQNVVLLDALPSVSGGWTVGGADSGSCSVTLGVLECDFGTVPMGQTRVVTLTATSTTGDCGQIVNLANVSASVDISTSDNEDGATVHVTCADVGVLKTAADDTIDVGGTASFTIVVTSYGSDAATGVTLTDQLPNVEGGFTLGGPDSGSCSLVLAALTCDFGTIPMGGTRTITLSATPGLQDCRDLDNTAYVDAIVDTNASNNASTASIHVACADVGVQKTAESSTIDVGSSASFSIVVTSYGPDAAENVQLADTLPALAGGWTLGGDNATSCDLSGLALTCDFGTVPMGATRTITLSGATALADCGDLANTATVGARLDTNASNNESSASIHVTCADVGIAKTASQQTIDVGANATFRITVTSYGPDAATSVTVDDVLPGGIAWAFVAGDDESSCTITLGVLSCDFGTLPMGATRNVTVTGATSIADCSGVTNAASVAATLDSDPENNDDAASIDVRCADVGIQKSASVTQIDLGGSFNWSLTITSLGPGPATNVTVTDVVPGGSVLGLGGNASAYCSATAGTVSCAIPSMAAGSWLVLDIETSSVALGCGPATNTARVGADVDTDSSNNNDDANVEITCPFATRTQGFWATHTAYTERVFDGAWSGTMPIGGGSHVRTIDTYGKLFGAWYSSVSYKTDGQKRNAVDQARMVLLQQLVTAKLNCAAFGCPASTLTLITQADAAYAGNNKGTMTTLTGLLDAYNNGGDGVPLPSTYGTPGSATPDLSSALANRVFWNNP